MLCHSQVSILVYKLGQTIQYKRGKNPPFDKSDVESPQYISCSKRRSSWSGKEEYVDIYYNQIFKGTLAGKSNSEMSVILSSIYRLRIQQENKEATILFWKVAFFVG